MEFLKRRIVYFLVLIAVSTTILAIENELTTIEIIVLIFTLVLGIILLIIVNRESQVTESAVA